MNGWGCDVGVLAGIGWECARSFVLERWVSWDTAFYWSRQTRMGCDVLTAWGQSSRFCARDTETLALEQKLIVYQSLGYV